MGKKRVINIDTHRNWKLKAKRNRDYVELIELHDGAEPDDSKPYVVIPVESVDELIDALNEIMPKDERGAE